MALFGDSERISVVAQIKAEPGREDDVRKAFGSLVGPSRREHGCLRYDLFEDKHDSGAFFTYEEWENEAWLHKHLECNKDALESARSMLRGEVQITVLKQVA